MYTLSKGCMKPEQMLQNRFTSRFRHAAAFLEHCRSGFGVKSVRVTPHARRAIITESNNSMSFKKGIAVVYTMANNI